MEEKELFEDYEMRSWEITPRIYKILGVSAVINFLFFFAFGQFNLLNTKACDNPLVSPLCQVMDAVYVGTVFASRDNTWGEGRPYELNEIADADITYIDVSDQLKYPEGYFAMTNPEQTGENALNDPNNFSSGSPLDTIPTPNAEQGLPPQVLPTPNDKVAKQDIPDSPFEFNEDKPSKSPVIVRNKPIKKPTPKKPTLSNDSPGVLPDDKTMAGNQGKPNPTPEPTPKSSADSQAEFNEKFNKKPLQDYADVILTKTDATDPKAKVDLKQSFTVVMDGVLSKDGKLDTARSRFVKREGSEAMQDVAKGAIEAVNNSGLLSYLKDLGAEKVNFTLIQDDKQIFAIIRSDQPNEAKAKSISSGLGLLISVAKGNVKEAEVQTLLNSAKVSAQGKSFILNFAIPKEEAHKIIEQKLQEARQKKSQTNSGETSKESPTAKGL